MTKTPLEKLGFRPQAPKVPASQMTPLQRLGVVNAFKEDDHKRDDSGRFSSGGGSGKKSDAKKSKEKSESKESKKQSKVDGDKEKSTKNETSKLESEYKQLQSMIKSGDARPGTESYAIDRMSKIEKQIAETKGLKYDPAGNTDWQRSLESSGKLPT